MGELSFPLVFNLLLYLSIPFAFGFLASRLLKSSPVVGYLVGGVIVGYFLRGVIHSTTITNFAHFGIILLFFTVGLEVNFSRIVALKKYIFYGGLAQIILTWIFGSILILFFGFNFTQAVLVGIIFVSSSTALVAKILQEKKEEGTLLGEISIGILMFQDLAFIPFIILFNAISQKNSSFLAVATEMLWGIFLSTFIIFALYVVGRRAVPPIFNKIARLRRDLFNFFIIIFILLVALGSSVLRIPAVVGAFIAGVFVAQTHEHYHIFSQIRPFRDLLAVLFFIYIGSSIELSSAFALFPYILLLTLGIILLKMTVFLIIFIYLRFNARFSFFVATHLFQIGETSFILLLTAVSGNILTHEQYTLILASCVLTLIITPIIIYEKEALYKSVRNFLKKYLRQVETLIAKRIDLDRSPIEVLDIKNHVIICGYGRVGSQVGKALLLAHIPFIAIDYNFALVERVKKEGVHIFYADPTDQDVLDFAEVEQAVAVVSAVPSRADQETIVLNAKKLNPKIFIIARVQSDADQIRMKDLGAQAVVQPELEASLSIIRRILVLHKKSKEDIVRWLKHLKLIHGSI